MKLVAPTVRASLIPFEIRPRRVLNDWRWIGHRFTLPREVLERFLAGHPGDGGGRLAGGEEHVEEVAEFLLAHRGMVS